MECRPNPGPTVTAVKADDVKAVIEALESSGIQMVALTTTWLMKPRLSFLHFWANDDAVKLARGLRSALDKMQLRTSGT